MRPCSPLAAFPASPSFLQTKKPSNWAACRRKFCFVTGLAGDRLKEDEKKSTARLLEILDRWGIRNLRCVATLPEVSLTERLGQEGLRLQQLARGAASRTLVPVEAPPIFEEAVEFEHPIVLLKPLAFLLNQLLEQICARLNSRALSTQELRLTLDLENFSLATSNQKTTISNSSDPAPASSHARSQLLKLLQLDLNAHPPGAPIIKIHLAAEPARPRSAQGGYSGRPRRNRKNWNSLSPASPAWSAKTKLERPGVARHPSS